MSDNQELIEQFVATLNERGLEPLFDDAVPPELRTRELTDIRGMFEWKICPAGTNAWVDTLEQRLPFRFPRLYHALISKYRFAEFVIGPILFLANTGTAVFNELSDVIFRDKYMSPRLMQHGFMQFGKEGEGGYDPICFDLGRRAGTDAPLVRIDHEEVLIRNRIRVMKGIAPSFESFVQQVIAGSYSTR